MFRSLLIIEPDNCSTEVGAGTHVAILWVNMRGPANGLYVSCLSVIVASASYHSVSVQGDSTGSSWYRSGKLVLAEQCPVPEAISQGLHQGVKADFRGLRNYLHCSRNAISFHATCNNSRL